jgi:hypothetical protein
MEARYVFPDVAAAVSRTPGDDAGEYAAMARWASTVCGGVACVQRLAGNVGCPPKSRPPLPFGSHQNPMASRSSKTVPRPEWGSALRMRRRLMALGCP